MKKLIFLSLSILSLTFFTSCESEEEKQQATLEKKKLALEQWQVKHQELTTQRRAQSLELQKVKGELKGQIRLKEESHRQEITNQTNQALATAEKEHKSKLDEAKTKANQALERGEKIVLMEVYTPINDHHYGIIRATKEKAKEDIAQYNQDIAKTLEAEYAPKLDKISAEIKAIDDKISEHRKNTPKFSGE